MPPITSDPPLHREFRRLLNPYLTPQVVAAFEPHSRRIVTELIDTFIDDGHCDLVGQLTRLFPPQMFYQVVFGIEDDAERARTQEWTHKIVFEDNPPDFMEAATALWNWINEFITARRAGPRRDDIIDGILYGAVEGRAITDEEAAGIIQILIIGGFGTTSDAISSTMLKLIEYPEIQEQLRREPSLIPTVFDEVLRMEPPVMGMQRTATRDVEIGGRQIREGEQILLHFGAANRDPAEFDCPANFELARRPNRHFSFGGGVHRCMGSNLARLNLRVVFEELLSRLDNIRMTDGEAPIHRPAQLPWGLDYLPLTFTTSDR
jgi:cytochrome P450